MGAYSHYGVSMYDTQTGSELWSRDDLMHLLDVQFFNNDKYVLIDFPDQPVRILSSQTGVLVGKIESGTSIYVNQYAEPHLLQAYDSEKLIFLDQYFNHKHATNRDGDCISALALATNLVIYSDYNGNLCLLDDRGHVIWYKWFLNSKFTRLYCLKERGLVLGVLDSTVKLKTPCLYILDLDTGTTLDVDILDYYAYKGEFAKKGSLFVSPSGNVYDLSGQLPVLLCNLGFESYTKRTV
ncbi:MAG: hypothetical protein PHD88_10560 [Firmicutes bacterium]|nr:hypothetical protein [Bacillota bacterium]